LSERVCVPADFDPGKPRVNPRAQSAYHLQRNANRDLAKAICNYVEVPIGKPSDALRGREIYVEINENLRGVNCFVVQPTSAPPTTT